MRVRFGKCTLDTATRVLCREGEPVHLTPKAFQLLGLLVEARPSAVSKADLQERLWPDTFVSEANLPTLVKEARSAIGDDARNPAYIRTVHGFGYAFAGAAETENTASVAHSLLVLPFENHTGTPELDYLCDGFAENITNAFSRVARFRVLSPRTAARWKGSRDEPEVIGQRLQVETVVHGRVSGTASALAIQVDAVNVSSGTQIWGNRFRARADQMYRIEEDVAAEVVDALQLRLSSDDLSRLVHRFTSNAHAYDLYLRGRFQWNRRTEDGLQRAIEHFDRAIVADPAYALPYAGIADVYAAMGNRDFIPPRDAFARALAAASTALQLAPSLAEAHASLGAIAEVHHWDWEEAGRKYRRAIELSPSYTTAYQWYALHFARRGLVAEAEQQMLRALDLDPLSVIGLTNAALISYLARDNETALDRIERALEIEASSVDAVLVRGRIREEMGDLDAAISDYHDAAGRSSRYTMTLACLGHALGRRGDRAGAQAILEKLETMRGTQYVSALDSAMVCVGLGRIDEAMQWVETGVREKSGWLVYLKTDPRVDELRLHPRMQSVLNEVGLAPAIV